MQVGVVGTGYVGLVTGTCLAEVGHEVLCVDNNEDKVRQLRMGEIPIHEPGLEELVEENVGRDRLRFTTRLDKVIGSEAIFFALPTPPEDDGSADLSYVRAVARDLGGMLGSYTVIVNKSTVPVGTAEEVRGIIEDAGATDFDVVSNPEFLREGFAVGDFMNPSQILLGTSSPKAERVMRRLYRPFTDRDPDVLTVVDERSAETVKYLTNALLAVRLSFVNDAAMFSETVGADFRSVSYALGRDPRIGSKFLQPGPGWGGSCFPKDTRALLNMAQHLARMDMEVVSGAVSANEGHKVRVPYLINDFFEGDIEGKRIAMWGLAFKGNTDDVRESPALEMARELVGMGAEVVAFDPKATNNAQLSLGNLQGLSYVSDELSATRGADALLIATEWDEFSTADLVKVKELMAEPVIFDARNLLDEQEAVAQGFYYAPIGRRPVDGRK